MRYSTESRIRIFVKGYGFLSFAKNMSKIIGRNIIKNLSSKYSQKLLDHAKQSAKDALKTASKKVIQKAAFGNLIGKIPDAVAKSYAVAKLYNDEKNTRTSRTIPSKA